MSTINNDQKNASPRYQFAELTKMRNELAMTKEEFRQAAKISRSTLDKSEDGDWVIESTASKIVKALKTAGIAISLDALKNKTV